MFERVTIRKSVDFKRSIDPGLLAESLLFFGKVRLLLDHGSLLSVLNGIGDQAFRTLVRDGYIELTYLQDDFAVHTSDSSGIPHHGLIGVKQTGHGSESGWDVSKVIETLLDRGLINRIDVKKFVQFLLDNSQVKTLKDILDDDEGLLSQVESEFNNAQYIQEAAKIALSARAPGLIIPKNFMYRVRRTESGFVISTNFDLSRIRSADGNSTSKALLLYEIVNAHADLRLAAHFGSDYVTSEAARRMNDLRFAELWRRVSNGQEQIKTFQDFTFDTRNVRGVVNAGERKFADFLDVLEKAQQFKAWLSNAPADGELLKAYYREVTKETWVDRLPSKATRFGLFTIGGLALDAIATGGLATAASLALGATDTFLIDKLIQGWKPNQFIDGPLRTFVNETE